MKEIMRFIGCVLLCCFFAIGMEPADGDSNILLRRQSNTTQFLDQVIQNSGNYNCEMHSDGVLLTCSKKGRQLLTWTFQFKDQLLFTGVLLTFVGLECAWKSYLNAGKSHSESGI